jgi:AraC-like DNA-binding protein
MQKTPRNPDQDTGTSDRRYDRLSALMARFQMRVTPAPTGTGNLVVLGAPAPRRAVYWPRGDRDDRGPVRLEMRADWDAETNPLLAALPRRVEISADAEPEAGALLEMLVVEAEARRCGADGAAARLTEVLLIHMLRAQIARGATAPGLLSGLADPRISRAIAAMHDAPGHPWRNADLASVAGLSLSRFAEVFAATVGQTPMSYLRGWRLTLARRQVAGGARIKSVARDLGYGSPEALTRAFQAAYGAPPSRLRAA